MAIQTILKLLPFIQEVVGGDDNEANSTDRTLLGYGFFCLLGFFICFLVMGEQAYTQALAKYSALEHIDLVERDLNKCLADTTYLQSIILQNEVHGQDVN